MPYLDLADHDNVVHLIQLYFAAHPDEQQDLEAFRAHTGQPDAYVVAPENLRYFARWARHHSLITRATEQRLVELVKRYERKEQLMAELLPTLSPEDRQRWRAMYMEIWGEDPSDEELTRAIDMLTTLVEAMAAALVSPQTPRTP
jgi:hypothetical protein